MVLTDIATVRSLMNRHGIAFQKKYGQNFLINEAVPQNIADSCSDNGFCGGILEIGPGIGTLTRELCGIADRVVAVEIDSGLLPVLDETLGDLSNVQIINTDFMKTDVSELVNSHFGDNKAIGVCANLPYYITTPIIMKLLESKTNFAFITVMVQKEVADRLLSKPGSQEYGAITAAVNYYGRVEKLFSVSAGSFLPPPKVESTVIRILPYDRPPVDADEKVFFRIIKAAFAMRRKTLLNALSADFSMSKERMRDVIERCGISPEIRGECLGIAEFALLSKTMYE